MRLAIPGHVHPGLTDELLGDRPPYTCKGCHMVFTKNSKGYWVYLGRITQDTVYYKALMKAIDSDNKKRKG